MSVHDHSGIESGKPLVVFAGRSNVGKSSVIRALTGIRVRVGKKPGSTHTEQIIDLGNVLFVDIPGFGHMSGRSKKRIDHTKTRIVRNLEKWSDQIALSVLIIDIAIFRELVERWEKRGEIPVDIEFYSFLSEISPKVIVAANKIDKVSPRKRDEQIAFLYHKLHEAVPAQMPHIVAMSARKKEGVGELKRAIQESLQQRGFKSPRW
jgi:GTP-binding protein EngB required for normal cell division